MANFRAKMFQMQTKLRGAQRDLERDPRRAEREFRAAARKLQNEVENPEIEIRCTCGYRATGRRSIRSLPEHCPMCGAPIIYL